MNLSIRYSRSYLVHYIVVYYSIFATVHPVFSAQNYTPTIPFTATRVHDETKTTPRKWTKCSPEGCSTSEKVRRKPRPRPFLSDRSTSVARLPRYFLRSRQIRLDAARSFVTAAHEGGTDCRPVNNKGKNARDFSFDAAGSMIKLH